MAAPASGHAEIPSVQGDKRVAIRSPTFAEAALLKFGSSDLLWTTKFALPSRDFPSLREQIADAVSRVISCGMRTSSDLPHSSARKLRLLFSACEALDDHLDDPEESTVASWRKVAQLDPNNAAATATLAFLEAEAGSPPSNNSPQAVALRTVARKHLQQARSINDRLGMNYAAKAILLPSWRYRDRLAALNHGLALDPDCAVLHNLMSIALRDVGDLEDAIASARRAVELEPSSAAHRQNLISALMYAGYIETAKTELESAERVWRDSFTIREVRSRFDFRFGDPDRQIQNIDGGNVIPNTSAEWQKWIMRTFLLARAKPTAENIKTAVNAAAAFVRRGGPPHGPLQSIVALGRTDEAYELLEIPRAMTALREEGVNILFRVNMRALRLDRRFMALANNLGLVQFWQSSGIWPDFCDDEDLPYDCKAEARRLHPKPP
jgi:tetratricopeptide (TPR) repeat protein